MKVFFDERQLLHAPDREMHNGSWTSYQETPSRAVNIADRLKDYERPGDFGLDPILQVHTEKYVDFLRDAYAQWTEAGREGDAIAYAFPIVGRRGLNLKRIDAKLGAFSFDTATPLTENSWTSAYWSVQTALSAVHHLEHSSDTVAFALCRPPGHHAGADYMGGYCMLNNAAVAARYAHMQGLGPVAVLDIDYHHGNGTQDIFYADPNIYFASIHADPANDYPFYWGHADEAGKGPASGSNLNIPLPRDTELPVYRAKLELALDHIVEWGSRFLVVSFGADTHIDDPISHFRLRTEDYFTLGKMIASRRLQTVIVMEGGYATSILGENVSSFLEGVMS